MTDQTVQTTGEQEGQQPGQAEPLATTPVVNTQQVLPKEVIEGVTKLVKDLTAKQYQSLVSLQAEQENRIKKEIQSRLEALSKAGVAVTPEQAVQIQEATRAQMDATDAQRNVETRPGQAETQPSAEQDHPAVMAAKAYMKKVGVNIEVGDPELEKYGLHTETDPDKFLESAIAAVDEKKERLTSKEPSPAGAPGVLGKGSASGDATNQYIQEMNEARGSGSQVGLEIKKKYRQRGVDVDHIGFTY